MFTAYKRELTRIYTVTKLLECSSMNLTNKESGNAR